MSIHEFRTRRPITGAQVVATSFAMAVFSWGIGFYGLSVYGQFLGAQGRWSVGMMSAATTGYFIAGSLFIGVADRLARRFGRRMVAMLGVVALAGGVSTMALVTHPVLLLAVFLLMAFGWSATSGTAITQIVGLWFEQRRGLATSLALTGASVAGFSVVPVMVWQIGQHGVAQGIASTALVAGAVMLLLLWSMTDRPHDTAALPVGQRGAATTASFSRLPWSARQLQIVAVFAVVMMAQVGFLAQQLPLLTPRVGADQAALAVAVTTASALIGRLLLGLIIDRLSHRLLTVLCIGSQIVGGAVLLATTAVWGVLLGCALIGLAVGNMITLPSVFVQREFAAEQFGPVVSRIWSMSQFFYAFGPLGAGLLMQHTGSGDAVLVACLVLQTLAALLCLSGRRSGLG